MKQFPAEEFDIPMDSHGSISAMIQTLKDIRSVPRQRGSGCQLVLWCLVSFLSSFPSAVAQGSGSYLPLTTGKKWVLRNPHERTPIVFEVVRQEGSGYRVRSTTPWGASEWTLVPEGQRYFMTNYNGMPLPADTLYLDFEAAENAEWKNALGTMRMVSRNATVRTAQKTYGSGITIYQSGGNLSTTYASGVGFVQFGAGDVVFVLDEAASNHTASSTAPFVTSSPPTPQPSSAPVSGSLPRLGIIPTIFANEPASPANQLKRYQQTVDAGINFMACYGKWNELEPQKGLYKLDSIHFQVSLAEAHGYPLSYTFQIIDTVRRTAPSYLNHKSWSDKELRSRVLSLIEALAPTFKDRVKWFMFGNEVDSYFINHGGEVGGFGDLYKTVEARLKELVPGIQVSTTIQFSGLSHLNDRLKSLNPQMDFLALTYGPYNTHDWSVQDPSVVPRDFQVMKDFAHGRKILLQEVAYPSSPVNRSSQEKQAEFYQNVFDALRQYHDSIVAASFMYLGDLPGQSVAALSGYYGASGSEPFKTLLQTLGMFDGQGQPKKSWNVFTREANRR